MNIARLSSWVCSTLSPAAVDSAPKEMPYSPVATETPIAIRSAGDSRAATAGMAEAVGEVIVAAMLGGAAVGSPSGPSGESATGQ